MPYEQNNLPGPCPRIKNTKIGDTVTLIEEFESKKKAAVDWKVVAVHKYFVEVENKHGIRRGLTFGDLRILGKE